MEPINFKDSKQQLLTIHNLSVDLFQPSFSLNENNEKSISIDGLVKATIQIPIQSTKRKLLLIVLVDKSRSIQSAWYQIQSTLLNLFSMVQNSEQEVILEILFFNNICYRLNYTKDNFRELILNEKPNGKTCFASAFSMTQDIITQYYKINSILKSERDSDPQTDTAIVLLTDGSHTTARDHKLAFKNLRNAIDMVKFNSSVVCSTMGFTSNSRFTDLDGIRRLLGNSPGIYQYSDPIDGAFALQEKLTFILKYVLASSSTFNLNINLETIYETTTTTTANGDVDQTTPQEPPPQSCSSITFNNEIIKSSKKLNYPLSLDQFGIGEISLGINSNGYNISNIKVTMDLNGNEKLKETMIIKPSFKNDSSEESVYFSKLIGLESKINSILTSIERFNANNKPSEIEKEKYIKEIISYQNSLSEIDNLKLFKIKSSSRSELVELKQQCLNISTQLLDMVNSWNRSEWSTTSNARVADITYRYLFKNTGRQRRMNLKIARNASSIKDQASEFNELEVDLDELESIEDETTKGYLEASKQLFTDVLSLSDWTEALEEKDIMGFGLNIQRPEHVIDDPTQIRIQDVSTTFICKSSIEDAIALSLDVHGQEKTTGGFEVGYDKQSVAVRGRGREPINSFLPLYLHKEHWLPIKYQLKNIIAYFVTLDPLAFSFDQINALFLVLGTMISKDDIGERELLLIIQFTRTLREVALHFKFIPRMLQQLSALLNNSIYLTSMQPKNLFVVSSYLLVLTDEELKTVFTNGNSDHFKFWQNILESSIRRACYTYFNNMEQTKIDSFLSQILFGNNEATIGSTNENNNDKIKNEEEEETTTTTAGSSSTTTPKSFDELFNLLLNYKFEKIENQEQDYGNLLNIKKKLFSEDDFNGFNYKLKPTNEFMVESMIKISNLLENRGYPNITNLLNSLRYVNTWRSIYKDESNIFGVIDSRFGIPPSEYIESMKNGIRVECSNNGIGKFINTINQYYGGDLKFTNEILLNHLRGMIVQSVSYRINKHATHAVVEKKLQTEVFVDYEKCIQNISNDVLGRGADYVRQMKAALLFSANTSKAIKSTNMEEFINTIPLFSNSFFPDFLKSMISCANSLFGEQKLIVFLSNVYVTADDYGNISAKEIRHIAWPFGKRLHQKLPSTLGIEKSKYIFNQINYYKYLNEKSNYELIED